MTDIVINDLTQTTVNGTGIFDVLMRANKTHLDAEFAQNRIKGSEYATVYLGSLESVMNTALAFLMQRQKVALEAQLMEQQILLAGAEVQKAAAQIALVEQQTINAAIEATVLQAQKCKLDAEYDMILGQTLKGAQETTLLAQKIVTEKAQTTSLGVDADSVVGKQKALYGAQTQGYARDAEQKAADLMLKTWMTRRTTDEGTIADGTNMLSDNNIGRAVTKLLAGVQA